MIKTLIITFSLLLSLSTSMGDVSNKWVKTFGNTPTTDGEMTKYWIEDIFALDSLNVYAILDTPVEGYPYEVNYAIHSKDGGMTWDTLFVKMPDEHRYRDFYSVFALDTNHIYIPSQNNRLWLTEDGFETVDRKNYHK